MAGCISTARSPAPSATHFASRASRAKTGPRTRRSRATSDVQPRHSRKFSAHARRSSSTASCLLTRLPRALSRGSQPCRSAAPACPNASPRLGQHEQLLLGRHRSQEQADHAAELVAAQRLAPRHIEHFRLVARGQPGDLPRRGRASAGRLPAPGARRRRASPATPAAGRPSSCAGPAARPPRLWDRPSSRTSA